MKLYLPILLLCWVSINSASFCDTNGSWKQVWKDDFNSLDTSSWTVQTGQSGGLAREALLTADNVYIENGNLVLRSQKQRINNFNWTTGAVISQNKKYWKYGRFCISAKLPGGGSPGQGKGIWPAHWMMPNDESCWPDHGEIDIMEMINGDGNVHGTYHWNDQYPKNPCRYAGAQIGSETKADSNWATAYHEYAAEWGPDYITFLYDSKPYLTITPKSNPTPLLPPSPMYMLLNTAVGGPWPGPPGSETVFPTYHYIDYVAVAQYS
eukprot:TRINITY_DN1266_c0_g1_i3.p1 TRINITY_DN1266_c0_g1~~TRINITY_DN1266_c0_g1_i3.p1  ORF type:complete len:266 (-),score=48.20 TRINITY_DN1266_c0_g1_i3:89-886(-)